MLFCTGSDVPPLQEAADRSSSVLVLRKVSMAALTMPSRSVSMLPAKAIGGCLFVLDAYLMSHFKKPQNGILTEMEWYVGHNVLSGLSLPSALHQGFRTYRMRTDKDQEQETGEEFN